MLPRRIFAASCMMPKCHTIRDGRICGTRINRTMPDRRSHRGPHPDDIREFAPDALPILRSATSDLSWLLTRGYALPSALKLTGDRYQLTARQRTAVSRCACSDNQRSRRAAHETTFLELAGAELWIDGYNVLTSIEAALAGGVLLRGRDGCLRDMASMHGSWRKVTETRPAIELIGDVLGVCDVAHSRWLLDQSVSNSGRLRTIILQIAAGHGWNWSVELVPDPDPLLAAATTCIATADSAILDEAAHWLPLARLAIESRITDAWTVDLSLK
jgi:hypothetical protein